MINREVRYKAVVHYKYFERSLRRVSKLYNVSKSSLQRWVHQDPEARKIARRRHSAFQQVKDCINKTMVARPFITMSELATLIQQQCGVKRSRTSMGRYRLQCGVTRKKAFRVVDAKHDGDNISAFCHQHLAANSNMVCIDEAGFYVGDHPRYGYAPRGKRLNVVSGKSLRRSKFTLLMAVSRDGIVHHQILDHNCKKADFIKFVNDLPVATGSTLLMDNVRFHHSKETVQAVKSKGCVQLFIPPYSPKFNAIENVFGTVKSLFRHRCPLLASADTNYKELMNTVLNEHYTKDLSPYFDHANKHSQATLSKLARGCTTLVGYDE